MLALLPMLLACGDLPEAPPPDTPVPVEPAPLTPLAPGAPPAALDLGPRGPVVVRLRDHLGEAELRLPGHSLPSSEHTGGRFVLDDGWTRSGDGRAWSRASPIRLPHAFYRDTPPGVSLHRGDAELSWSAHTAERAARLDTWEIEDGRLWVTAVQDPGSLQPSLVLSDRATAEAEDRMALEHSGLTASEFARWRTTIDGVTRDVVLLPAPGSARFDISGSPGGGTLRLGHALAPPARPGPAGHARLSVDIDGVEVWSAEATTGQAFTDVRIPVPSGARSLTLRSDAMGDPEADWAVFAEPELVPAPSADGPRRVVLVGIDTLRPDHLSRSGHARPTSPGMDEIASQSIVFDRTWAPAPRTRPSFRTALTGRWPLAAIGAPTLAELLAPAGFTSTGIVANVHFVPRLGMADGSGSWHYADSADAGPQVDKALGWLQDHAHEDTLLFLHLMDPHVFYLAPEPFRDRFTTGLQPEDTPDRYNRWVVEQWAEEGRLDDETKAWMEARYDGEIAYLDREVHRLVQALDALPGRTLVIFLSDHGEEFWEHGSYEHNHTLYDEVTRALLWVRPPGGRMDGAVVTAPTSLADIVPTVLDAARVPAEGRPVLDGISLAADGPALPTLPADRSLPIGHLMFAPERWAVVHADHKYILETGSGREELYDLVADPGEQHSRAGRPDADLARWRSVLAESTGFEVHTGWRLTLQGTRAPFRVTFPTPVEKAWIVDPEALRDRRANLEWGEVPPVLPDDVAVLRLEDGGRTLVVTPGREGRGVVAVAGPEATDTARAGGAPLRVGDVARLGGAPTTVTWGALIRPTDTEAARLAELQDPDAIDALRAMGYLDGPE